MTDKGQAKGIDPEKLEQILDIIQALNGTLINIRRYPPGSSVVQMAIERGVTGIEWLFERVDHITFSENERLLLVDDHVLSTKNQDKAFVVSLRQQMVARNMRSITLRKGITQDEMVTFLTVLSDDPERIKLIPDISKYLTEKGVVHIEVDKKVFVALDKSETVTKKTDLEQTVATGGADLEADSLKDGMFLSFLMEKLPNEGLDISEAQLKKIKDHINFDKIQDSKDIDFERLGPALTTALEKVLNLEDDDAIPKNRARELEQATDDDQRRQVRKKIREDTKGRDARTQKLVDTFQAISNTILSFDNPKLRAKLLADFIKVVTNFKSLTLARILTTNLESPEGVDIKATILSGLNFKKKSKVVDSVLRQVSQVIEGLAPEDFELDLDKLEQSEQILTQVISMIRSREEKSAFGERAKKAMQMSRLIRKEAKDSNALLVLKMRRLIQKPATFLLEDPFTDNFADLVARLIQARRPEIVRKLIERCASNFDNDDVEIRIAAINAFVLIIKDLFAIGQVNVVGDCYSVLLKKVAKEQDPRVFAMTLASVISGFSSLIDHSKFNIAGNMILTLERLRKSVQANPQHEILVEGVSKITRNQDVIAALLVPALAEENQTSESVVRLLISFPTDAVLPQLLTTLRRSEDMRERKRCLKIVSKLGDAIVDPILQDLGREQPWYYVRNLLNLLSEAPKNEAVETLARYINHRDERVRKSTVTALCKNGSPRAQQVLVEALDDSDESIVRLAVSFLGQCRAKAAAPTLINKLSDKNLVDHNPDLACEMIFALGRTGAQEASDVLCNLIGKTGIFGIFQKRNDDILVAVFKATASLRDPKGAAIAGKFVRDKNPEVARAAKLATQSVG